MLVGVIANRKSVVILRERTLKYLGHPSSRRERSCTIGCTAYKLFLVTGLAVCHTEKSETQQDVPEHSLISTVTTW